MTEIRPFRALRYDPARVTPDDVIAPPYDVVGADDVAALHARSPYNAAHLENPPGDRDQRFEGAARTIERWQQEGVLVRDPQAAVYVYEQHTRIAALGGAARGGEDEWVTRRCFFARTRLHRPEEGIIRPHEATLAGPREERLLLLRATQTNISPVFGMFLDPGHVARDLLATVALQPPTFEAHDRLGDRHRLWVVDETGPGRIEELVRVLDASHVTIADGHHRTHTALDYRDERAAEASDAWTGNEPENFVLMGLIPADDPGLVILPIHRLLLDAVLPEGIRDALATLYDVEAVIPPGGAPSDGAVDDAWARVRAHALGPTTFAILGLDGPESVHLATARSQEAVDAAMPAGLSEASRRLDAVVLTETVLAPIFDIDRAALAAGERVAFTESVEEAREAVRSGHARLAFLVNATRVEQVTAVADAGEVMPQKTTFYYPKLATGLVFNRLDN